MAGPDELIFVWSAYMRHRVALRGYDLDQLEEIVRHSTERYFDTETRRLVVVGRHGGMLVNVPYEQEGDRITPVTVHAITRQQIRFRRRTGRWLNE